MRRGFTLIATMITIALILFLAVYLMNGGRGDGESIRKDGVGKTYLGASMARANDAVCIEHLRNMRLALEVATNTNGDERPTGLEELHQPADYLYCPIGKEPYVYDPAAASNEAAIKCVHVSHEKY